MITALKEQGGADGSQDEQASGARQHYNGKNEKHGADAEAAEQARGQQQLKQQCDEAGVKIEITEENRKGVLPHTRLLGQSFELPAG